ncbi:hypothetical protein [Sansalvadorimonas verongulae]|uniref:hypothetical protein n=1 Tax=Sansalvadorimonas verongulae TaxID=2172824 RepID=UPI0012BBDC26|nr:hypothetical protein [Sansalvadorimonas verongulae]MTI12086.1 hypothetical protein [Sansalvadorimonas verongulae]
MVAFRYIQSKQGMRNSVVNTCLSGFCIGFSLGILSSNPANSFVGLLVFVPHMIAQARNAPHFSETCSMARDFLKRNVDDTTYSEIKALKYNGSDMKKLQSILAPKFNTRVFDNFIKYKALP